MSSIADYRNNTSWLQIVAAVVFLELLYIVFLKSVSQNMREWYNMFGLLAVLADVGIILIAFALARYLTTFLEKKSLLSFVLILVLVQVMHDLCYYFFLVKPFPVNRNGIIDYMKSYGKSAGLWAIAGDTAMVVSMAVFASALSTQPAHVSILALLVGLYGIPYAVT
jgi:hypothetical protein